jgi:hypothetical protein
MLKQLPLLGLIVLSGCMTAQPAREAAPVHHVIVCWLRTPGNARARTQLIETSYSFKKIAGVRTVHAGGVVPSSRPVVDSSFDVAIVITFENINAMQAYLADSRHEEAVGKVLRPLVKRMHIYNFIDGRAVY